MRPTGFLRELLLLTVSAWLVFSNATAVASTIRMGLPGHFRWIDRLGRNRHRRL
jgi:hypothetical protein